MPITSRALRDSRCRLVPPVVLVLRAGEAAAHPCTSAIGVVFVREIADDIPGALVGEAGQMRRGVVGVFGDDAIRKS